MHELWTIYQLILKGTFFGTPCRLGDQKSQISNLAHIGIVMVGIKRPRRVSQVQILFRYI